MTSAVRGQSRTLNHRYTASRKSCVHGTQQLSWTRTTLSFPHLGHWKEVYIGHCQNPWECQEGRRPQSPECAASTLSSEGPLAFSAQP